MEIRLANCSATGRLLWAAALLSAVAAMVVQLLLPAQWQLHCRFHAMTGLPCPACGATRCVELLLHGHLPAAARAQPLLFVAAALSIPLLLYALPALCMDWPLPRIRTESRRERAWLAAGLGLAVAANWIYLVCRNI